MMNKLSFAAVSLVALASACAPEANLNGSSIAGRAPGSVKAGLAVAIGSTTSNANSGGGGGQGGNAADDMQSIFIHVVAVAAHAAGTGWVQLSSTPTLVDLLKLQDSADALGFAHLPSGTITQIRLYIVDDGTNHVVTKEGASAQLTVPSGIESGVKLQGPFDLGQCENGLATGIVDLDKSILVHGHGNHDDFILRPTIHHTEFDSIPADVCNPSGGGNGSPIPGGGDTGVGGSGGSSTGGTGSGSVDCPPNTEGCTPGSSSGGTTGTGGTNGTNGTDGTGAGSSGSTGTGSSGTGSNGHGNGSSGTGSTGTGSTGTGSTGSTGTGSTGTGSTGTGSTGTGSTGTGSTGTSSTGTGSTGGSSGSTSGSTTGTAGAGSTTGTGGAGSTTGGGGSTGGSSTGGSCANGGAPVFVEGIGLVCG
jgi:hypothetical protein